MTEFQYTIKDPLGIHARPAGELVKLVKDYSCSIKIEKDGKSGDCKRIFGVMGLAAKQGDQVVFRFDGEDETEAYKAVEEFVNAQL